MLALVAILSILRYSDFLMPTYEYRCLTCREEFEIFQSFAEDTLVKCPAKSKGVSPGGCVSPGRGKVEKLFSAPAIIFKGQGFYKTDSKVGASSASNGSGDNKSRESASRESRENASGKESADKNSPDKNSPDKNRADKNKSGSEKASSAKDSGRSSGGGSALSSKSKTASVTDK